MHFLTCLVVPINVIGSSRLGVTHEQYIGDDGPVQVEEYLSEEDDNVRGECVEAGHEHRGQ